LVDPARALRSARVAAVLVVLAGLALAWRIGVFHDLTEPSRLAARIVGMGAWGQLAFVVAYTTLQPFGVPGTVFIVAAPLLWPWPTAFALSMTGTMAASVVGFSFARFVARDFVSRVVPERFRRFEATLERRGFATVVLLRFVFWMPPLRHAFFGVSRVPFWTHFAGSLVGYVVPLLAVSYFGQRLFDWMRALPPSAWVAMLGATALLWATVFAVSRARARRAAATSGAESAMR
jgi:uncharacterized membrane protein YdjX (TVP38/TMEM64 family)